MSKFLPPANEVCEGYVFTPVCHSVHGGVHPPRQTPPGQTSPPTGQTPPGTPPEMATKRAVRILLECILVTTCNEVGARLYFHRHLSLC